MKLQQKNSERLLLWILVGALSLGQLGRFSLSSGVTLYPHDILIVFWTGWLLALNNSTLSAAAFKTYTATKHWHPFILIAALTTALALTTTFSLVPLLYLARVSVHLTFAWALARFSKLTPNHYLVGGLGLVSITALIGFLQLVFIPDTRFLSVLGFDDHYYRMIGTQLDPAFMGALFLLGLVTIIAARPIIKHRLLSGGLLLLFTLGVLLTFSRASYLGLIIFWIYWLTSLKLQKTIYLGISVTVAILATYGVLSVSHIGGEGTKLLRTSSIAARAATVSHSLPQSEQELLIGTGLYTSAINDSETKLRLTVVPNQARVDDSLVLFILSGTGLWGLIAFGYALVVTVKQLNKKHARLTLLLLGILFVITQFNNTLLQPFVLVSSLLVFLGLTKEYR